MTQRPMPPEFAAAIRDWPGPARERFALLRKLILAACPDIDLTETVKWGEPAWLPARRGVGSTLRVAWKPSHPDQIALFVHCATTLAATMRELYPQSFDFEGNRALRLGLRDAVDTQAIDHLARLTLRYHLTR